MSSVQGPGVFDGRPESGFPGPYDAGSAMPVSPYGQTGAQVPQAVPAGYGVPPGYGSGPPAWYPPAPYPVRSETDPGIDRPWYGIGFLDAYRRFWKKYATFSGRASRGEFWWATLANVVIAVALGVVIALIASATVTPCTDYEVATGSCPSGGNGLGFVALIYLYPVAIAIPTLAIIWRRLHDAGQSGALYFISVIPLGNIVLLILLTNASRPDGARYDRVPAGAFGGQQAHGPYLASPYGSAPYGPPPYGP